MRETRIGRGRLTAVALVVLVGMLAFHPAAAQTAAPRTGRHATGMEALRRIHTRVSGIDLSDNRVALRDAGGEMAIFEISPDIADLQTIQIGDTVDIAYRNAILTRVDKVASNGIRERIETEVIQPSSDGEVTSTQSVQFVATVLKIDRKNREVTLRGPTQTQARSSWTYLLSWTATDCLLYGATWLRRRSLAEQTGASRMSTVT